MSRVEEVPGGRAGDSGTQAVDRAALLISSVVQADEPLSFADLQEACDLPKSTTSRMLTALERSELLERDDDGSYVAGSLFWLYAARHDPWEDLVRLAAPTLGAIGEETHETVNLSVARADRVRPGRAGRLPLHPRHPRLDPDRRARPLLVPGQGVPRLGRVTLPDGPLDRPTDATVGTVRCCEPSRAQPASRLGDDRRRARGRVSPGSRCRSSAPRGQVVGAVGVSGPTATSASAVRRGRTVVERPCRGAHRAAPWQDTRERRA